MPEVRGRPDRHDGGAVDGRVRWRGRRRTSDSPRSACSSSSSASSNGSPRSAPVVLVIEDLQWADPSTRDLLAFLVRNLRDERVLLIATIRTDEVDPRRAFLAFLAELERDERVDRIDLARLDRDDLARLLADELGHAPDAGAGRPDPGADRREPVLRRAGGRRVARDRRRDAVPARLRDVVLARVAAVSDAGQEVLRVASAAGTRIDDELLVAVCRPPGGGGASRPPRGRRSADPRAGRWHRTTRTSRSVTPCSGRSSTTS